MISIYGNIATNFYFEIPRTTDDFDFSSKGLNSRKTNEIQTLDRSIDFSKFNDLNSTRRLLRLLFLGNNNEI